MDAQKTLWAIHQMFAADEAKIKTLGRAQDSAARVFAEFKKRPILTVAILVKILGLSKPTVMKAIRHLIDLEIVAQEGERRWGQMFIYTAYAKILGANA